MDPYFKLQLTPLGTLARVAAIPVMLFPAMLVLFVMIFDEWPEPIEQLLLMALVTCIPGAPAFGVFLGLLTRSRVVMWVGPVTGITGDLAYAASS